MVLSKREIVTKQVKNFGGCGNFTVRRKNCCIAKWHKRRKLICCQKN
jgi:hypothetical protein